MELEYILVGGVAILNIWCVVKELLHKDEPEEEVKGKGGVIAMPFEGLNFEGLNIYKKRDEPVTGGPAKIDPDTIHIDVPEVEEPEADDIPNMEQPEMNMVATELPILKERSK